MLNVKHLGLALASVVGLVACGSGSNTASTTSTNYGNTFYGNYTRVAGIDGTTPQCRPETDWGVKRQSTGAAVYEVDKINITTATDQKWTGSTVVEYYADSACTQLLSTVVRSMQTDIEGPVMVQNAAGQYMTMTETFDGGTTPAQGGIASAQTITFNGLVFPADYFNKTLSFDNVVRRSADRMFFGDTAATRDPAGYPNTWATSFSYLRK